MRAALAGGPLDGALVRVAATGALERSREVALDYARRARACLNGELHRDELESLTHAVVNQGEVGVAVLDTLDTLAPIREKIEAGERLDFEDGLALMETDDLLALGELADLARRRARRRRRGLLRPEPLLEPDERLPREVQVLRVREDAEAGGRVHDQRRRARRGRGARSTSSRTSRRSTASTARTRTSTSSSTPTCCAS